MKCVILQPCYLPWRGYFHLIQKADVFVFYDDVQYDRRGWRNRNRFKTPSGPVWLTVPVHARGAQVENTPINEIHIDHTQDWARKHWLTLKHCYRRAPFFRDHEPFIDALYRRRHDLLADLAIDSTLELARVLGLEQTQFLRSSSLRVSGRKTDRLLEILKRVGASRYLSGPAAKDYLEETKLNDAGIAVEWMDYRYAEYPQLYPPYDPQVSVLDLLFMTGPAAPQHIWGGAPARVGAESREGCVQLSARP